MKTILTMAACATMVLGSVSVASATSDTEGRKYTVLGGRGRTVATWEAPKASQPYALTGERAEADRNRNAFRAYGRAGYARTR